MIGRIQGVNNFFGICEIFFGDFLGLFETFGDFLGFLETFWKLFWTDPEAETQPQFPLRKESQKFLKKPLKSKKSVRFSRSP